MGVRVAANPWAIKLPASVSGWEAGQTLNHRLRKQNPSPTAHPQQTQLTAKPDFCAACRKRGKEEGAGGP